VQEGGGRTGGGLSVSSGLKSAVELENSSIGGEGGGRRKGFNYRNEDKARHDRRVATRLRGRCYVVLIRSSSRKFESARTLYFVLLLINRRGKSERERERERGREGGPRRARIVLADKETRALATPALSDCHSRKVNSVAKSIKCNLARLTRDRSPLGDNAGPARRELAAITRRDRARRAIAIAIRMHNHAREGGGEGGSAHAPPRSWILR